MLSENEQVTGRRKILSAISHGAAYLGLAAIVQSRVGAIAGSSIDRAVDSLWGYVDPKPADVAMAKALFFGASYSGLDVVPSHRSVESAPGHNKASDWIISEPTQYVLRTAEEVLRRTGSKIVGVDEVNDFHLSKNALLLGGPVANVMVKSLMGENGTSERFIDKETNAPVRFPFHFALADVQRGEYRTEGRDRKRSPDWTLVGDAGPLAPISLRDGRPAEDHVLITSVPNLFNQSAHERGDRVVVFAGRHGVATRSMALFLGRPDITGPMIDATKSGKAWQAIVRVDSVDADGITPLSLGNFGLKEIGIDFSRVIDRQTLASPHM